MKIDLFHMKLVYFEIQCKMECGQLYFSSKNSACANIAINLAQSHIFIVKFYDFSLLKSKQWHRYTRHMPSKFGRGSFSFIADNVVCQNKLKTIQFVWTIGMKLCHSREKSHIQLLFASFYFDWQLTFNDRVQKHTLITKSITKKKITVRQPCQLFLINQINDSYKLGTIIIIVNE